MTAQNAADLFTEDEWVRFIETGREYARAHGSIFVLDETAQIISQRAWATYLRNVMVAVGVDDLAARIVPENYPPTPPGSLRTLLSERRDPVPGD